MFKVNCEFMSSSDFALQTFIKIKPTNSQLRLSRGAAQQAL